MDDIEKTIAPRREPTEIPANDVTMPGKRDRKPHGKFSVGDLIMNRYKVLAELGQGGMGVVYRCLDEIAGIEVALKALPPELSYNAIEMEDIKDNFQLVHNLHHPNIASSNNLERDNSSGDYYLIMECCEGEDLRRWIRRERKEDGRLKLNDVLPIIRQVADALDYAHEMKIIHRDIKPGNIMINADKKIKVLDFGLAAQIHTSMSRVSMAYHGTSGTGPYMAPEQWRGRAQSAPADQYALAVMAYEMLSGHLPFESSNPAVLKQAVLDEYPDDIADISKAAQGAIKRAMSKNPAERFESCSDFAAALGGKKIKSAKTQSNGGFLQWIASAILLARQAARGVSFHLDGSDSNASADMGNLRGGSPASFKTSFEKELESANQGDAVAQYNIGVRYSQGDGVAQDYSLAVSWYHKAAEQGNVFAQNNLGWCYEYGRGVEQDYSQAAFWYRKAAEQGNAVAQSKLGDCYYYARGVLQNYSHALSWYHKAAEQGNAAAQNNLGDCYYYGRGVEQNLTQAVSWYRKAAEQREPYAQSKLGVCYYYGRGVAQDYALAVFWYRKAAEQGNVFAQNNLGDCYFYGRVVMQDLIQAVAWYRKAAEQGYAIAQNNLGRCYECGKGVGQDNSQAVFWYREAAEQGDAAAQNNLGDCYYYGRVVAKDLTQAVTWYHKAAEQGEPYAQNKLGVCYYYGRGVEQDLNQAVFWYHEAAEQGNAAAQNALGDCYYNGRGVAKDYSQAVSWYRKAAEQGEPYAQSNLGWCYEYGRGVEQDLTQAVSLYRKAAAKGQSLARENLKRLGR